MLWNHFRVEGEHWKDLSIEYEFPSGTHLMGILCIHLIIYSPECISMCELDLKEWVLYFMSNSKINVQYLLTYIPHMQVKRFSLYGILVTAVIDIPYRFLIFSQDTSCKVIAEYKTFWRFFFKFPTYIYHIFVTLSRRNLYSFVHTLKMRSISCLFILF